MVKHVVDLNQNHPWGAIPSDATLQEAIQGLIEKKLQRLLVMEDERDEQKLIVKKKFIGVLSEVIFFYL
jgi:CBS domain-containing protein